MGRDMEAEECFRRALVIDQAVPSAFHLRVAVVCLDLASRAEKPGRSAWRLRLPARTHIQTGKLGRYHPRAHRREMGGIGAAMS